MKENNIHDYSVYNAGRQHLTLRKLVTPIEYC